MDCHIKTKYFHEKNCKKKIFNAFIDILKLSIKKLGELQKNPTGKICSEVYFNTTSKLIILVSE